MYTFSWAFKYYIYKYIRYNKRVWERGNNDTHYRDCWCPRPHPHPALYSLHLRYCIHGVISIFYSNKIRLTKYITHLYRILLQFIDLRKWILFARSTAEILFYRTDQLKTDNYHVNLKSILSNNFEEAISLLCCNSSWISILWKNAGYWYWKFIW